jgi:serine/threonine-protein kinase RsbT
VTDDAARVPVSNDIDVVTARRTGREMAARVGFTSRDLVLIATAISEIARNTVRYAGQGEVMVTAITSGRRRGITIVVRDDGPGIEDIDRAMLDGFSTGKSLGLGLPGARRLMDDFEIVSSAGQGTTVTMSKWLR